TKPAVPFGGIYRII
ncbi:MAG: hypothetical protein COW10_04970, partial [Candidatus Omnitrophica bacterium CG12_big_fil_rev_8_21_14_0_65_42_8]